MAKDVRFSRPRKEPDPPRRRSFPFWLPVGMLLGFAVGAWAVIELGDPIQPARQRPAAGTTVQASFPICGGVKLRTCVIYGDTIRYHGQSIRLEDINAPETHRSQCAAEKALGDRATRRLAQLINEGPFEMVNHDGRDEDKYGRKLRTLERGGRSLGAVLVTEGLARKWVGYRRSWCG